MPLLRKVPDVTKEQIQFTRFRGSSADAHPCMGENSKCPKSQALEFKWASTQENESLRLSNKVRFKPVSSATQTS